MASVEVKGAAHQMQQLLSAIREDYKNITLVAGERFHWSPQKRHITYTTHTTKDAPEITLLHELAHAVLDHKTFKTDYELLLMEVEAWEKARELGTHYNINIPGNHVQDCLDTYRDWLYMRSTCPSCGMSSLQDTSRTYKCSNCTASWRVSSSRLCRPYRKLVVSR